MSPVRIAIYSHDTFGLGHLTRSTRIARTVVDAIDGSSVLLFTGSPIAHRFSFPRGVDYVKLPSVVKRGTDDYPARDLQISQRRIRQMRRQILLETIATFRPHLLMVDNVPQGMKGEILPVIHKIRNSRSETEIHLNLRDVLDEPDVVRRHWQEHGVYGLLEDDYDAIHVFGTPQVCNAVEDYGLPPEKTHYVGHLTPGHDETSAAIGLPASLPGRAAILVTIGGGGDGAEILERIGQLQRELGSASPYHFHAVTGPLMEAGAREAMLESFDRLDGITLHEYVEGLPTWMSQADLVLSMGGYNTMCEVMVCARRSVVIPRVAPRREQEIRARALERLGLVSVLHPDDLTPASLDRSLRRALQREAVTIGSIPSPLNGGERLEDRLAAFVARQGHRIRGNGGMAGWNRDDSSTIEPVPRRRRHLLAGRVILPLLLAIGVGSCAAARASVTFESVETQLDLGYDNNLLNASDAERRAFDENAAGSFFVVNGMEDLFLRARIEAALGLGRPFGMKTKLRGAYRRIQFLDNQIKSENLYTLRLQGRPASSTRLGIRADYTPQIYGRHRVDKGAEPGDPVFRAETHSRADLVLEWNQGLGRLGIVTTDLTGTWKNYDPPFEARDQRRIAVGIGLERRITPRLGLGIAGGFRRARTRNDPERDEDRSYREWGVEPAVDLYGLNQVSRLRASYRVRWRHYTSEFETDENHFDRDDLIGNLYVEATRILSPTVAVRVILDHEWRSADLRSNREIDFDEEGSSTNGLVSAGFVWRWEQ